MTDPEANESYQDERMYKSLRAEGMSKGVFFYVQNTLDSLNLEKPKCCSFYSQREEIMNTCKQHFRCFKSTENSKAQ